MMSNFPNVSSVLDSSPTAKQDTPLSLESAFNQAFQGKLKALPCNRGFLSSRQENFGIPLERIRTVDGVEVNANAVLTIFNQARTDANTSFALHVSEFSKCPRYVVYRGFHGFAGWYNKRLGQPTAPMYTCEVVSPTYQRLYADLENYHTLTEDFSEAAVVNELHQQLTLFHQHVLSLLEPLGVPRTTRVAVATNSRMVDETKFKTSAHVVFPDVIFADKIAQRNFFEHFVALHPELSSVVDLAVYRAGVNLLRLVGAYKNTDPAKKPMLVKREWCMGDWDPEHTVTWEDFWVGVAPSPSHVRVQWAPANVAVVAQPVASAKRTSKRKTQSVSTPTAANKELEEYLSGVLGYPVKQTKCNEAMFAVTAKKRKCLLTNIVHDSNNAYIFIQGDVPVFRCHSEKCKGREQRLPTLPPHLRFAAPVSITDFALPCAAQPDSHPAKRTKTATTNTPPNPFAKFAYASKVQAVVAAKVPPPAIVEPQPETPPANPFAKFAYTRKQQQPVVAPAPQPTENISPQTPTSIQGKKTVVFTPLNWKTTTQRTVVTDEFMRPVHFAAGKKYLFIEAPMGVGKSTQVRNYIQQTVGPRKEHPSCLILVNRITMAAKNKYEFPGFYAYNELHGAVVPDFLICEIESLHRFADHFFSLVIMDETRSLLSSLACVQTNKNMKQTHDAFRALFLSESNKVICMDADMSADSCCADVLLSILKRERYGLVDYLLYTHVRLRRNWLGYDNEDLWHAELVAAIQAGQKLGVPCRRAGDVRRLYAKLSRVIGDTTKLKIYIGDSTPADKADWSRPNEVFANVQVVLFSSVVTVGCDVVIPFDSVWYYAGGSQAGACARESMQQVGRFRNVRDTTVRIYQKSHALIAPDLNQELLLMYHRQRTMDRDLPPVVHFKKYATNAYTPNWATVNYTHQQSEQTASQYLYRLIALVEKQGATFTWSTAPQLTATQADAPENDSEVVGCPVPTKTERLKRAHEIVSAVLYNPDEADDQLDESMRKVSNNTASQQDRDTVDAWYLMNSFTCELDLITFLDVVAHRWEIKMYAALIRDSADVRDKIRVEDEQDLLRHGNGAPGTDVSSIKCRPTLPWWQGVEALVKKLGFTGLLDHETRVPQAVFAAKADELIRDCASINLISKTHMRDRIDTECPWKAAKATVNRVLKSFCGITFKTQEVGRKKEVFYLLKPDPFVATMAPQSKHWTTPPPATFTLDVPMTETAADETSAPVPPVQPAPDPSTVALHEAVARKASEASSNFAAWNTLTAVERVDLLESALQLITEFRDLHDLEGLPYHLFQNFHRTYIDFSTKEDDAVKKLRRAKFYAQVGITLSTK
jgi:hypothetical protein